MNSNRSAGGKRCEELLSSIPSAGAWHLFCFCLATMTLVWLPMAVLQQIDGLLNFVTWAQLTSDIALIVVLLALMSCMLSLPVFVFAKLITKLGTPPGASHSLAWFAVGIPVVILCTWQFAYMVKQWIEHVGHVRIATGGIANLKAFVPIPVAILLLVWHKLGTARLVCCVTEPMIALRIPAVIIAMLASAFVAWHPPAVLGFGNTQDLERPRANANAPDIIMMSLDSLATKDAGLCGTGPATMPHLRALAARSTCFTRYYAVSNLTAPTTTTMETSSLPWTHWVIHGSRVVPALADESIGAHLQQAGYRTHSISAAPGASPDQHGTYRGYDSVLRASSSSLYMTLLNAAHIFPDSPSLPSCLTAMLALLAAVDNQLLGDITPYPPERVYDSAKPLLAQRGWPLFLWLHTWPPHAPYLPPPNTKYKLLPRGDLEHRRDLLGEKASYDSSRQPAIDKLRLRYRETIMDADEKLGAFLASLEQQNRLDNALVIVTTDHGESFERGALGHGGNMLHEAVIRIPLLIKLPGQTTARTIDMPTSQADLAPTLLELAGAPPLSLAEGRSLRAALMGQAMPEVAVLSMAMETESRFRPLRGGHYALIDGFHKLIYHLADNRWELYDLATDPNEEYNIANAKPEIASQLRNLLKSRMTQVESQRRHRFAPSGLP